MQSVSVTEAKQAFTLLLDAVEKSNEPVCITRRGDPAVVLMSLELFDQLWSSQLTRVLSDPQPGNALPSDGVASHSATR